MHTHYPTHPPAPVRDSLLPWMRAETNAPPSLFLQIPLNIPKLNTS